MQGHDHPWLQNDSLAADNASWTAGVPPQPGLYGVKTRYRQADAPTQFSAATEAGFSLAFGDHPQWAVTPGQSAVLYDGDVCLGGGIIAAVDPH